MFGKLLAFPRSFRHVRKVLASLALLAAPIPVFAQSCALCYTQAASSGARVIEALKSGILILIVPPTLMSIGMIFIVYHKRNQFRSAHDLATDDLATADQHTSNRSW
ncbi:MAG TPA: hypothetical protein VKR59_18695 [Terriglobales bacterium]|nr:hypothetical protein [Terriglobales bacterium]